MIIELANGHLSDDHKIATTGTVPVTVTVPVERFAKSFDDAMATGWIEPSIVEEEGWHESDLRVALATLVTVMETVPMLTTDFVKMILATGCRNTVRHVVAREFDLVERVAA